MPSLKLGENVIEVHEDLAELAAGPQLDRFATVYSPKLLEPLDRPSPTRWFVNSLSRTIFTKTFRLNGKLPT